jgi:hypothetical protein
MNRNEILKQTLLGLELTAKRKVELLGTKKAQDDLERIKDMFDEIVCFWEFNEELIDDYDENIKKFIKDNEFNSK